VGAGVGSCRGRAWRAIKYFCLLSPGNDVKLTWFPAWLCVSRARST
jgi:hypothetical protein